LESVDFEVNGVNPIIRAFARNRAEEIGDDLWTDFIVPLYFDMLPFDHQRKPLVFMGGRGCGKTTLLRYLSHRTQFSPKREGAVPTDVIGLYLRADTQFLRLFQGDELNEKGWHAAFGHFLSLTLSAELLDAVVGINCNELRREQYGHLDDVTLDSLKAFDASLPTTIPALIRHLKFARLAFASWLNNASGASKPNFYPYREFLSALIDELRSQLAYLGKSDFLVFIDEYENLLEYQQRIINTAIKHSEPPLIFNIAMKCNGMETPKTVGSESIQHIGDYRRVDIEEELEKHNFPLFAAELFFFRLEQQGICRGAWPIDREQLSKPAKVAQRRENTAYATKVLNEIRRVLPGQDNESLCAEILSDPTLNQRLTRWMQMGLSRSSTSLVPEQFVNPSQPVASVVCGALLNQDRKRPDEVYRELLLRLEGKSSDFTTGEWEHHYCIGSILYIYATLQRPCPLYAGFKTFITLSRYNSRHFLELCHAAVSDVSNACNAADFSIPIDTQARAARKVSGLFLDEIQGSGDHGNRLHTIVATLGQIFQLSQQRPSQSETERTHFSLSTEGLSDEQNTVLSEAVKWSILFGAEETKVKSTRFEQMEYQLNPIYAPHFGISYNKGRKLELSDDNARVLLSGPHKQLSAMIQVYQRSWFKKERDDGQQIPLIKAPE
jgi:hypothetical protein